MRVTLEASASDNNTANTENGAGGELSKAMPKDAQVMGSILRDMGICEWEPRVINQLLEFSYNYVTCVLDDAKQFSNHALKKSIDVEDVRLAVQMFTEKNVTTPPSRDTLLEVARSKNISTLPIPRPNSGLRLPPDRFCLTACNYKLKTNRKQPPRPGPYYGQASSSANFMVSPNVKTQQKMIISPAGQNVIPAAPQFNMTVNPHAVANRQMVKIGAGTSINTNPTPTNKIQLQPNSGGRTMFTMTINPNVNNAGIKRKADEIQ